MVQKSIHKQIKQCFLDHEIMIKKLAVEIKHIADVAYAACRIYRKGGKLVFCGNGGSAADAQHLAAEMVSRFMKERKSLPALALHTNTSTVTAIGNDYGFDVIFSRQIESLVSHKDMVFGITTSGNSPNIINGIRQAQKIGALTVCLSSVKDTTLWRMCDFAIRIPSTVTARIQEGHIVVGHIICGIIEEVLFP